MAQPLDPFIHTNPENTPQPAPSGGPAPGAATTRLAPSPTGALHLGNARTFLVNWALARQRSWRIVLRIEDLDGPRVRPEAIDGVVRTLAWLGIDWDEGPLIQSQTLEPCRAAMTHLAASGLAYRCELSRTDIEAAASAPQSPSTDPAATGEVPFPPSLRPATAGEPCAFTDTAANWRFLTPPPPTGEVAFLDECAGLQRRVPANTIGDFVLWTKRGTPAYQLAVVVDDHRQHITHIVRGDDLLDSAARQLLLYRALGFTPEPFYTHLPLVIGPDGRRLAKRHGDTRVDTYRAQGVPPERLIGLVAHWCGATARPQPCTPAELVSMLDARAIPRSPIIFLPEHDAWLRARARS
ncbi:MAG: glutamate--tRNA ligase family protein [Phycisphaerales bacterium]